MKQKRARLSLPGIALCLSVVSVLLAGAANGADSKRNAVAPQRGGTIKVACQNPELSTLDPVKGNQGICQRAAYLAMYDTLVQADFKGKISPGLASSWKVTNGGRTYTLQLRKATFHDGSPVTAAAVRFSVLRMLDPKALGSSTEIKGVIRRVLVINPTTVRIVLFKQNSAFLFSLSRTSTLPIVNPAVVRARGGDISSVDAGSGPFTLVSANLAPNGSATFKRYPNYWKMGKDGKPLPYLDGYVLYPVQDLNAMQIQLRAGDIDVAGGLAQSAVKPLAQAGYRIFAGAGIPTMLVFNEHTKPYDRLLVRQAFTEALDRKAITKTYTLGTGWTRPGMFALGVYDVKSPDYKYDPVGAKAKLARAGYPNGFDAPILVINRYPDTAIAQLMQTYLAKVGINLKISTIDRAAYVAEITKKPYTTPLVLIRAGKTPEPNVQVATFFAPDAPFNFGWNDAQNKAAYAAGQKALTTNDPEERAASYAEVNKHVVAANIWVNMGFFVAPDVMKAKVLGYTQDGSYTTDVTAAWFTG
jgi:glutathione transport system substrate-binding protein